MPLTKDAILNLRITGFDIAELQAKSFAASMDAAALRANAAAVATSQMGALTTQAAQQANRFAAAMQSAAASIAAAAAAAGGLNVRMPGGAGGPGGGGASQFGRPPAWARYGMRGLGAIAVGAAIADDQGTSPWSRGIGEVAGLAWAGSEVGSLFGPVGTAVGAGLGAVGGAFEAYRTITGASAKAATKEEEKEERNEKREERLEASERHREAMELARQQTQAMRDLARAMEARTPWLAGGQAAPSTEFGLMR